MPAKPLELATFLATIPDPGIEAPCLFHTTKGQYIYDVLGSRKLEARPCPVFDDEPLLYLFVGRPAYKLANLPVSDFWLTPLVFVFNNPTSLVPKRVYPFDSGSFVSRRLGEEFSDFDLGKFELSGDYANYGKVIKAFFGSVSKYLRAEARTRDSVAAEFKVGPQGFAILALSSLLTKNRTDELDDRNSVIEVQFAGDLELKAPDLKGVVIAEEWLDDPELKSELESLDCIIETYPIYPLSRTAYQSKIYEACERINAA